VLNIFIALVPAILTLFSKLGGCQSLSEIDLAVCKKLFLFQVGRRQTGSVVLLRRAIALLPHCRLSHNHP
jgi:Calcium-dependent channel, 7TM region, putative phosphate